MGSLSVTSHQHVFFFMSWHCKVVDNKSLLINYSQKCIDDEMEGFIFAIWLCMTPCGRKIVK